MRTCTPSVMDFLSHEAYLQHVGVVLHHHVYTA